jgi:hypothetical protein
MDSTGLSVLRGAFSALWIGLGPPTWGAAVAMLARRCGSQSHAHSWTIRIRVMAPRQTTSDHIDVFLLHASEDKARVARPLALELGKRGLNVWLDEFELAIGDSLAGRIDAGLQAADAAIAIISPAFLGKRWPRRELATLLSRELKESTTLILPVWHDVSLQDVLSVSPELADRLAADTSSGLATVADQITRALTLRLDLVQPGSIVTAIGPEGRSLALGSPERATFDLRVTEFNDDVIAALAAHAGFEVELTPASGDGGVDVYAIRRDDLGSTLTVVQAKRYKPELKVGVGQVRELFGTVNLQDASAGVLITTSSFESGAKALAANHQWRLELRDYARLQEMLRAPSRRR